MNNNEFSCIDDYKYNFELIHYDDYFIYKDLSFWVTPETKNPLSFYKLKIDNDGNSKIYDIPVNGNKIIMYSDLPGNFNFNNKYCYDGIYKFEINICEQILYKYEPILNNIQCAFSKLLIKEDNINNNTDLLIKLQLEIQYIKETARLKMFEQSKNHYNNTVSFIKMLDCACK